MSAPKIAPYGSWKSPITAESVLAGLIGLGRIILEGEDIYWVELRPVEGGRQVVVRRTPDGVTTDCTPAGFNARTRVHEYGGGEYAVLDGVVYFTNFTDQRLYRYTPDDAPQPLTPTAAMRYADVVFDTRRGRLICVREDHTAPGEAVNTLVSLSLQGGDSGHVLVSGNDFYSNPRLSPDGRRLTWLTWNHPNLPWDGTELWAADVLADGSLADPVHVAGGEDESIFQPEWSPDGVLYFVSDRTGWWNLYRWREGGVEPLWEKEAEFALPQWTFGRSMYAFASAQRIICAYTRHGASRLASLDTTTLQAKEIDTPYSEIFEVRAGASHAVIRAGSPTQHLSMIRINLATFQHEVLRSARQDGYELGYISIPQAIEFPTEGGLTAYGYFYPPRNRDYTAPASERPPLLVMSHGGPTGSTPTFLDYRIQFWTSRGIAVLDVNYGGSTSYGRPYRQRLNGQWGVVDVDDCVNGARYLVQRGDVDGERLAITGGSAGGYTTLCALTFRDAFKAGASHFGISDLVTFAKDTHKFESRYLDRLVGPYPECIDVYRQRSPIHYIDQLNTPMILLQGLEDVIVPPSQSERMFEAVKAKGLPVAYLAFEGEQHGFRKAENARRALEAELYFYSKVFGFDLADEIEPVQIENL